MYKVSQYPVAWCRAHLPAQTSIKSNQKESDKVCVKASNESRNYETESSWLSSVTDVKGALEVAGVDVYSTLCFEQVLVLGESAGSHAWIAEKLAESLKLQGPPTTFTVRGNVSQQTIHTPIGELSLTPIHLGDSRATFTIKPHVRKDLSIGTDINDVTKLKQHYLQLEPVTLSKKSHADVEKILDQDTFHLIRPREYFQTDCQDTPVTVHLPMEWGLSGPLPST